MYDRARHQRDDGSVASAGEVVWLGPYRAERPAALSAVFAVTRYFNKYEGCLMGAQAGIQTIASTIVSLRLIAAAVMFLSAIAWAQTTERSGKEVVDVVCITCHGTGANGAPKIGDKKAWAKRTARGLTGLTKNAIKGVRKMPAHGGNANVSDFELERAITYMVNKSGGHWAEPFSKTAQPPERSGKQIVEAQCVKCHLKGVGGAPKIGDRAAWIPRGTNGIDPLVRSAIGGHGGMPARGGMADLTDNELRGAVIYMFNSGVVPVK
jgi:cytochrome c5